mmetsp:Transcript_14769/g.37357  ORF Transcript_14769/g.37357 Transcript_14769/m.37357 type:complete len:376 (-) Transcript_14769:566-1693(-)
MIATQTSIRGSAVAASSAACPPWLMPTTATRLNATSSKAGSSPICSDSSFAAWTIWPYMSQACAQFSCSQARLLNGESSRAPWLAWSANTASKPSSAAAAACVIMSAARLPRPWRKNTTPTADPGGSDAGRGAPHRWEPGQIHDTLAPPTMTEPPGPRDCALAICLRSAPLRYALRTLRAALGSLGLLSSASASSCCCSRHAADDDTFAQRFCPSASRGPRRDRARPRAGRAPPVRPRRAWRAGRSCASRRGGAPARAGAPPPTPRRNAIAPERGSPEGRHCPPAARATRQSARGHPAEARAARCPPRRRASGRAGSSAPWRRTRRPASAECPVARRLAATRATPASRRALRAAQRPPFRPPPQACGRHRSSETP